MSDDLPVLSARQLLERIEHALRELLRRGIVRSRNEPLGDVAERIVWLARGGTLEPNSARSHDVTTHAGDRIQVKARTTLTGGRVKGLGTEVTDEMRAAHARLDEVASTD